MDGAPPPGWYPDPWQAAASRWWDGEQWTADVQEPFGAGSHNSSAPAGAGSAAASSSASAGPAGGGRERVEAIAAGPVAVDVRAAVVRETSVARWVRWAVLVPPVLGLVSLSATARSVRAAIDAAGDNSGLSRQAADEVAAGTQLAGMVALTATVAQMVWTYLATTSGRLLGVAGRRSPGLASVGWIIPVVNYWWPYQDVGALFPQGQRPTRQLRCWWALHVLTLPLLAVAVAGMVIADGPLAVWAPLAVLPPVGAAVLLRELIDRVSSLHRDRSSVSSPTPPI